MKEWSVHLRLDRFSLAVLKAEARSSNLISEQQEFASAEAEKQYLVDRLTQYFQRHGQDVSDAAKGVVCVGELSKLTILILAKECGLLPPEAEWKDAPRDIYEQVALAMTKRAPSVLSSASSLSAKEPVGEAVSRPSLWRVLWDSVFARTG